MRKAAKTSAFKRCVKLLNRRHWDLAPLVDTIGKLQRDVPSSKLFKDHPLVGSFADKRECHVTSIADNWVLVYQKVGDDRLILYGTGTHADVFGEGGSIHCADMKELHDSVDVWEFAVKEVAK